MVGFLHAVLLIVLGLDSAQVDAVYQTLDIFGAFGGLQVVQGLVDAGFPGLQGVHFGKKAMKRPSRRLGEGVHPGIQLGLLPFPMAGDFFKGRVIPTRMYLRNNSCKMSNIFLRRIFLFSVKEKICSFAFFPKDLKPAFS